MNREIVMSDASFLVCDNGEVCWVDGKAESFWDVFEAGTYDPKLLALIDRLVKPKTIFFDAGAWVGAFSLYAAAKGATSIAVEPDPVAFAALTHNASLNADFDFHLFPFALAPTAGTVLLANPETGTASCFGLGITKVSDQGLEVEAGSFEQFLVTANVDPADLALVKVDIEGFEVDLMPVLAPWLAWKKIPVIVSLHGCRISPTAFEGFKTVASSYDAHGEIVALPFVTLDTKGLE